MALGAGLVTLDRATSRGVATLSGDREAFERCVRAIGPRFEAGGSNRSVHAAIRARIDESVVTNMTLEVDTRIDDSCLNLRVVNGEAQVADGLIGAPLVLRSSMAALLTMLSLRVSVSQALADGSISLTGDRDLAVSLAAAFNLA